MSKRRPLRLSEELLNDSRLTPQGNGDPESATPCTQPTSAQKWWAAILFGFIFAILASPLAYYMTNLLFTALGGAPTKLSGMPSLFGLIIHTILFTLVIRLILW